MTEPEIEAGVRRDARGWTRRAVTGLLAGAGLPWLLGAEAEAKKKKKKKKKGKGKKKGGGNPPTCSRTCGNRTCGDDGCGGSCGTCTGGTVCEAGQCVAADHYEFDRKWGSGGTGEGQFQIPWGIAVDANADVYVVDSGNNRVQKFTSVGAPAGMWGEFGGAVGQFYEPVGVTVSAAGHVYVADSRNHRIQRFTSIGAPDGAWGEEGAVDGKFTRPQGIAFNPVSNLLYITDNMHTRVQVFNESTYVTTLPLTPFAEYRAVTVAPDGTVYVVSTAAGCILKLTAGGEVDRQIGTQGSGQGQLSGPWDVAVDAEDRVFVADRGNNRIQVFDAAGNFLTGWGKSGSGDGEFIQPMGIDVDADGNVYVTDLGNARVQKFRPAAARRKRR